MKLAPVNHPEVRLLPRGSKDLAMIDLTEEEHMSIVAAMRLVAEIMEEIGWETRLIDLTRDQVMTLIEVAVGGFQDAMHAAAQQVNVPHRPLTAADAPY